MRERPLAVRRAPTGDLRITAPTGHLYLNEDDARRLADMIHDHLEEQG